MKLTVEKQNFLLDLYLYNSIEMANNPQLPTGSDEINDFLELAAHNKVGANLYLQLKALNIPITESLLHPLEEIYNKIKAKNIRRLEVGIPILNELKKQGVDVIILKGNAIAEEVFGDLGYKPMNDIDILVKKEDLGIIYEIYQNKNLLTAAPLESDIRKQEKYSHHWPPFFEKKLDVFLGTHWNISAPTRGLDIPIQDFWKDKEEFKLMGESFYRLSPKHFLMHLCVHLNSAKTGLRELGDIVKIIEIREKELNVLEFSEMVIKAHAEFVVFESLHLVKALRSFPFVEGVLKKLSPHIVDESFKRKILRRSSPRYKLLHIRTNYISKIEKNFALFMLTEAPLEKTLQLAKMWKLYLLVPSSEALRLNYDFPDAHFFKRLRASLLAPLKISQVFINDLGLVIFLIVTIRHQWVLFVSYLNYINKKIKGKPIHSLESYANTLGLTLKEIKEISSLD